jgi:hypothetical protein
VDNVNFLCTISNVFKWLCAKSSFLPRVVGYGVYIVMCFVVSGRLVGFYTMG